MAGEEIAKFIVDIGIYDVVIPFIFVFTIIFAILQKAAPFGTYPNGVSKKNIHAMISFVVGFIFIVSINRVIILENILQRLALALVGIVAVVLLLSVFGNYLEIGNNHWIKVLMVFISLLIFGSALGVPEFFKGKAILDIILSPLVVIVVIFLAVLYFIIRGSSPALSGSNGSDSGGSSHSSSGEDIQKPNSTINPPSNSDLLEKIGDEDVDIKHKKRIKL